MSGIFNPPRALQVPFNPAGNIASTNVQAMGEELDAEKVAKSGDTMTGKLTIINSNGLEVRTGVANGGGILLGANLNSTNLTADTRKVGVIRSPNYANISFIEIFSLNSPDVNTNTVSFGGRVGGSNTAATEINFITAADTTSTGGTLRGKFDNSGNFQMDGANTVLDNNRHIVFRRYTVGTVPAAGSNAGRGVMVTPTSGNERLYTSNGTNWYDGAGVILS